MFNLARTSTQTVTMETRANFEIPSRAVPLVREEATGGVFVYFYFAPHGAYSNQGGTQ